MATTTAPTGSARVFLSVGALRRRHAVDLVARAVVAGGGLAVIGSILAILVFLVVEVWPLLDSARVRVESSVPAPAPGTRALLVDARHTHAALLGPDGVVRVVRLSDGAPVLERPLLAEGAPEPLDVSSSLSGQPSFAAATRDGRVALVPVEFAESFAQNAPVVTPRVGDAVVLELDPEHRPLSAFSARLAEGGAAAAAQLANGKVVLVREVETTNFLTGEKTRTAERAALAPAPGPVTHLLLDRRAQSLYGALATGELVRWDLTRDLGAPPQVAGPAGAPVTALELLIGDLALVVGRAGGEVEVWFPVPPSGGAEREGVLERVHTFPPLPAAVVLLSPSGRNRSFFAQDAKGNLGLYYSTSERVLWTGASLAPDASALAFAPKGDAVAGAGPGRLVLAAVHNPHPEASLRALFGKVHYEGAPAPAFVWQSSSGSDDFEPKLSLTPLLAGTLKGTFYSLILAIPLGVLGAMYTSQFMHPRLQRVVKPTVELMASLPSVVLGFLAGLWLAPLIESKLAALLLYLVGLPILSLLAGALWFLLPRSVRGRIPAGGEVLLFMAVLAAGAVLCWPLGTALDRAVFGGSLPNWLYGATGLRYDQRNAVVVGIAMGFAVVPIIFAISEDAISNVPSNLRAGSLALGANLWQTVVRVVLPTASPGIFSAVMVGLGRAVGETMIVLMATGNTPILGWSPFNGFRTLSANIAVEVPEAPAGSTLFRTLFLAALLLFALTFALNTVAELVRQRLRQRYARL
ncbi:MAG TPA: ABC transporter permease [Deltaproteobacteria bacterium]|nr:ABC transporter permease [Deltaproteobacteria bacterium]